jgi:hypothetical protein
MGGVFSSLLRGECSMVSLMGVLAAHDDIFGLLESLPRIAAMVDLKRFGGRAERCTYTALVRGRVLSRYCDRSARLSSASSRARRTGVNARTRLRRTRCRYLSRSSRFRLL